MLASLIRLRQSQSANKGSNCDRGERWTITLSKEEILPLCFFLVLLLLIPPAQKHTHTHIYQTIYTCTGPFSHMQIHALITRTYTKQGAVINPNPTAVSHTVTVATVAGSMQNRSCHISCVFSLHHTQTQPHFSYSYSCADLSAGLMNKAVRGDDLTAGDYIVQFFVISNIKIKISHLSFCSHCICVPVMFSALTTVR